MILPALRAIMPGSTACDSRKGAVRLVAISAFQSDSGNSAKRVPSLDARVVDQDVDRAVGARRLRDTAPDRVGIGYVEDSDPSVQALAGKGLGRGVEQVRLAAVQDDGGARTREAARNCETEAAIGAGDERHFSGEVERLNGHCHSSNGGTR